MHRQLTTTWSLVAIIALVTVFAGCAPPGTPGYGTVVLRADVALARATVEPTDSDPSHLRVFGTGPSGATLETTAQLSQPTIVLPALAAGWWRFDVDAENSDDVPVLTGSVHVLVQQGLVANAGITLLPPQGDGTLAVTYRWPAGSLTAPVVSAALSRYVSGEFEAAQALAPFVVAEANGIVSYSYSGAHPAGYYELEQIVLDGAVERWANVDTVRVRDRLLTEVRVDLETGDVEIIIVLDPRDPLTVTLTPSTPGPLGPGENVTVTATVAGGDPPYAYRWYLNGVLLPSETTGQVTIGAGLLPGRYTLSLVASDGTVLGSESFVFDVGA